MQAISSETQTRFDTILKIVNEWWGGLLPTDQCTLEQIDQAETRFGVQLPTSLRFWYLKANSLSNRLWCFGMPDDIFALEELVVREGYLIFAIENQSCWYACIRETDLGQNDPVVVFLSERADGFELISADELWIPNGILFSEFLLLEIIMQTFWKGQFQSKGRLKTSEIGFARERLKVEFQSDLIGSLFMDSDYLAHVWVFSHESAEFQITHKSRKSFDNIVKVIPPECAKDLSHRHNDRYWKHDLTPECHDLEIPFPEGVFPECHLNSLSYPNSPASIKRRLEAWGVSSIEELTAKMSTIVNNSNQDVKSDLDKSETL